MAKSHWYHWKCWATLVPTEIVREQRYRKTYFISLLLTYQVVLERQTNGEKSPASYYRLEPGQWHSNIGFAIPYMQRYCKDIFWDEKWFGLGNGRTKYERRTWRTICSLPFSSFCTLLPNVREKKIFYSSWKIETELAALGRDFWSNDNNLLPGCSLVP